MSSAFVWVVEDNDQNFELVEFLLGEAGYRIVRARDRVETERLAEGERPDLVLLDMNLPSGSGIDIVEMLRRHPEHQTTPIIALTAHAMRGDRERFLAAGCDGYLSKPIETTTFLTAIAAFLADSTDSAR